MYVGLPKVGPVTTAVVHQTCVVDQLWAKTRAMNAKPPSPDPYFSHWADLAAKKTLAAHQGAQSLTVAAGITPSGEVHIGNFREVITVDLVARALRDAGVDVRFIYSWDDFDVFRKVPKNMPQADMLTQNLGRSIVDVPDPFGEHASYADRHIQRFESSLAPLGIAPEFIRQSRRYRAGDYAEGIATALRRRADVRNLINRAREKTGARTRLGDDWLPLSGFCSACGHDDLKFVVEPADVAEADRGYVVDVVCQRCGHSERVDLRKGGNLKLPWRVDWPMRWSVEKVAFEPGGKDHSSDGGSYDTAKDIVRELYSWTAPQYVGYDFVRVKGRGGKISSSSGDVVTVADCLKIFEPRILRWIFVGTRPNRELQVSFDLDVIKIYEDFDRMWRLAYTSDDGSRKDKKRLTARRTMQLSDPEHRRITPGEAPFVPQFRHLSMILQIHDGDIEGTCKHYEAEGLLKTDEERALCRARAHCVWNWIELYAPPEFRYKIRTTPTTRELSADETVVLKRLCDVLANQPNISERELIPHMKTLCEGTELDNRSFLPVAYDLLLGRPKGPKMTTLIITMGTARAHTLLSASLAN